MSGGAAAGAAAQAAAINAMRCFGVVVTVNPDEFLDLVMRQECPLVVTATGGFFAKEYRYLMSYKGLAFFTKSADPLDLPADSEVVQSKKIYIPV